MKSVTLEDVLRVFDKHSQRLLDGLIVVAEDWPVSLDHPLIKRVLVALMARQITLTNHVLEDCFFWTEEIGPLILRPLLENWFKLEWILLDPLNRSCSIVKADILGALQRIELFSKKVGSVQKDSANELLSDLLQQESVLFSDIEVKSTMLDVRNLSLQLGGDALTAYRRHFVRFSSSAHSSWNYIARFNLAVNPNPLHRFNYVPIWKESSINLDFPILAAEYCQRALGCLPGDSFKKAHESLIVELSEIGVVYSL